MKIDPVSILLRQDFDPSVKFLFISGNEITLIQSIKRLIIKKYQGISRNIRYSNLYCRSN